MFAGSPVRPRHNSREIRLGILDVASSCGVRWAGLGLGRAASLSMHLPAAGCVFGRAARSITQTSLCLMPGT